MLRSMLHEHGCNFTCTHIATRINQQAFLKWSARESNDILDLIQFNVCGHMKIPSQGGWLQILYLFIDHFSEYYYVFHLKDKIGIFTFTSKLLFFGCKDKPMVIKIFLSSKGDG
jgi:hypothetical protein